MINARSMQEMQNINENQHFIKLHYLSRIIEKQNKIHNDQVDNLQSQIKTEVKKRQELRETYRALMDSLPLACGLFDNKLKLIYHNPKAQKIFMNERGFTSSQNFDINSDVPNPERIKIYKKVLETGIPYYNDRVFIESGKNGLTASLKVIRIKDKLGIIVNDTSRQLEAEEKLIESQINLKRAQRIAKIGNWEWNLHNNFLTLSEETFNLLGIKPTVNRSVKLNYILENIHPLDKGNLMKLRNTHSFMRNKAGFDFRFLRPDNGREIYINCIWETAPDHKESITRFGILQDITQFKLTEMKLGEARQKFNLLVNSIDEIFWITKPDLGHFYYVSPAVERIWPFSFRDLIEDPNILIRHIVEEDRDRVVKSMKSSINNKGYNEVYRISMPDGKIRWLHGIGIPVPHPVTGEARIVGTTRDITALKEKEKEALQLASAIEQSTDGIIICNLEGKITYCNSSFVKTTGYQKEETLGRSMAFFRRKRGSGKLLKNIFAQTQAGVIWSGKITAQHKNGQFFPIEFTVSPIKDKQGNIINFLAIITDITKQEALEKQLRHAQKMETIGTLTSGIAHDFNNILATIQGYLHFSIQDLEEDHPIRPNLDQIMKASDRATNLVKQILNFSRKSDQTFSLIHMKDVIKETLELVQPSIPYNVELIADMDNINDDEILGDSTQINQVILNLLTNSFYAMKEKDGNIKIQMQEFIPSTQFLEMNTNFEQLPYLKISIEDQGVGMDKKTTEKIFDPFYTTKPVGEGTGLGLSVVHGIIDSHKGHIIVESEPGIGTRFEMYFPKPNIKNQRIDNAQLSQVLQGKKTLLLLDDLTLSSKMNILFNNINAEVVEFFTEEDALEHIASHANEYSLMIADQTFTHRGGLSFILEAMKVNNNIKGIFISNKVSQEVNQIKKNHNIHLITKPFTISSVKENIMNMLKLNEKKQ